MTRRGRGGRTSLLLLLGALATIACRAEPASEPALAPPAASRFDGVWVMASGPFSGELRLQALDGRRLRLEFSGAFESETEEGPSANVGAIDGTAAMAGDSAFFAPGEPFGDCAMLLRLRARDRMEVGQTGECGFGLRVNAGGDYRRASAAPPFGSSDPPR